MLSVVPMDITSTVLFYHGKSIVLRLEPPAPPISLNYHWLLSVAGLSIPTLVRLATSAAAATSGRVRLNRLPTPMVWACIPPMSTQSQVVTTVIVVSPSAASILVISE